jgi:hypothetical protein
VKKRIFLVLVGLLLVSQVPFAYRRHRLGRLQEAIQKINAERVSNSQSDYVDYRGVIHVHTSLGGHSTGTFAELIAAAKANQLDFVIMTEHPQAEFDTATMTLNGTFGGVLFINGNEVVTANGDRLLLIPGSNNARNASSQSSADVVGKQKSSGGLVIAAYPIESTNWKTTRVDGSEVYNLFVNARETNKLILFFDGLWSYRGYANLMFANFFARPAANLKQWDELNSEGNRRLVATAGNDAHSNVGLSVNDATGKQLVGMKLDPYERSFHTVRTHVLIQKDKPFSRESALEALSQGHSYISFDLFGDPRGFVFTAANTGKISGDEMAFQNGMQLRVKAPLSTRMALFRNGSLIDEKVGDEAAFSVPGPGTYRVECYLNALPEPVKNKPWIISNPIYLR